MRIRERLDEIAIAERPANVHSDVVPDVWASPEIVVEVLADELTRSPMHVAGRTDDELGLALRFPASSASSARTRLPPTPPPWPKSATSSPNRADRARSLRGE